MSNYAHCSKFHLAMCIQTLLKYNQNSSLCNILNFTLSQVVRRVMCRGERVYGNVSDNGIK